MVMAQRLCTERPNGSSSPGKVHPWLLLHCPGFALTFLSYNRLQSWEWGPLPHLLSAQLRGVWGGRGGAVLESSAAQLFSQLGFYSQETDRSESKKQRLQIRRSTALIRQILSAQKRGISVILKTFSPISAIQIWIWGIHGWKLVNSRKELLLWNLQQNLAPFLGIQEGQFLGKECRIKNSFGTEFSQTLTFCLFRIISPTSFKSD